MLPKFLSSMDVSPLWPTVFSKAFSLLLLESNFRLAISLWLSLEVAEKIGAEPGKCYLNALHAQSVIKEAFYVEGFVASGDCLPVVYKHAWLETVDGVVEPTRALLVEKYKWMYFAAARWTYDEINRLLRKRGGSIVTPLLKHHFTGEANVESGLRAMRAAVQYKLGLCDDLLKSESGNFDADSLAMSDLIAIE